MNEKIVRALVEAGAVRQVRIVADRGHFYVEIQTSSGSDVAQTLQGRVKTWANLNSTAKWVRSLGIGEARLFLTHWTPNQKRLPIER